MAINDDLYAALSAYPQTTLPERLYAYLGAQGYTGAMGDRLAKGGGLVNVIGTLLGNVFDPGIWNHAAATASGGSQILGTNRYRIFSPDGSYSAVQINNLLTGKNSKLFQFRLTVESITAGASIIMGDDVGNDITVTGVGTHTGTWVVNGPTATIKRASGVTDIIIKDVQLIEVNRSPVTAADIALGDIGVGAAQTITAATLLSGVTDPDGDTLAIVGYAVHTGSATITGSGPYTLTPTGVGAGTASFTTSDGRGGVVTRGVTWNGILAGLSGGTAALGWSAASLDDGTEITITTDGTYDFGTGPTLVKSLGNGAGYVQTAPLGTVLNGSDTFDGWVVEEGGARRIEEHDGVRVVASRLFDAGAWSGMQNAGRYLSAGFGRALNEHEKVAVFHVEKNSYALGAVDNWQYKIGRFRSQNAVGVEGEFYWRGMKTGPTIAIYNASEAANSGNNPSVTSPHISGVWQSAALLIDTGTAQAAFNGDAKILSRTLDFGGELPARKSDRDMEINAGTGLPKGTTLLFENPAVHPDKYTLQNYVDSGNFSPEAIAAGNFEPSAPIDLRIATVIVQLGSWGVVELTDAPDEGFTRYSVPQQTLEWTANSIKIRLSRALLDSLSVGSLCLTVRNGDTGDVVGSVPIEGTFVPPAYNPATDLIGLSRGTGSAGTGRIVFDTDLAAPTGGQVATLSAWIKPASLARRNGFCDGRGTVNVSWCVFESDGSITARIGGATRTLRAAGAHTLVSNQRHLIAVRWSVSQLDVLVDDNVVGSYSGSTAGFLPGRFMEGNNVGFNGVCYNIAYAIDGTTTNRLPLNEGTGTAAGTPVAADIGSINGTISGGMTWVAV